VYLFIFGELIDAYQNRAIPHREHLRLALRGRYFLDMWKVFLEKGGYQESRYFISRESYDIAKILVDGLLSLVTIHRDHIPNFPLLPWLHSSETCEHVFAECRKLLKDFTFLDFIYMQPKLRLLLRTAISVGESMDPRARAEGYFHSYFDPKGVDFATLAVFPSQDQINATAMEAHEEAVSLFAWLGVRPVALHSMVVNSALPSISSWFPGEGHNEENDLSDLDSDSEEDGPMDAEILQEIITQEDSGPLRNHADSARMLALTNAAVMTSIADTSRM
jgi:hypothetical protein